LEGRKTQTRRILNPQPIFVASHWRLEGYEGRGKNRHKVLSCPFDPAEYAQPESQGWFAGSGCPYGKVGDRLWVRETWCRLRKNDIVAFREDDPDCVPKLADKWRPSIFMPRWASRITLEITGVRVERLQDISEEGAIAEGVVDTRVVATQIRTFRGHANAPERIGATNAFRDGWNHINGKRKGCSWADNPFVWVVSFKMADKS
jgi:hypothetical protein